MSISSERSVRMSDSSGIDDERIGGSDAGCDSGKSLSQDMDDGSEAQCDTSVGGEEDDEEYQYEDDDDDGYVYEEEEDDDKNGGGGGCAAAVSPYSSGADQQWMYEHQLRGKWAAREEAIAAEEAARLEQQDSKGKKDPYPPSSHNKNSQLFEAAGSSSRVLQSDLLAFTRGNGGTDPGNLKGHDMVQEWLRCGGGYGGALGTGGERGFTVQAVDDDAHRWRVCVHSAALWQGGALAEDMTMLDSLHGFDFIEFHLTHRPGMYPFAPPAVDLVRPRFTAFLLARLSSLASLQLTHWDPIRGASTVIGEVISELERFARVDVESPLNDMNRFPGGAYLRVENQLCQLGVLTETPVRVAAGVNISGSRGGDSSVDSSSAAEAEASGGTGAAATEERSQEQLKQQPPRKWAKGTGYGSSSDLPPPAVWAVELFQAAQAERDRQVCSVIEEIARYIRRMYGDEASDAEDTKVATQLSCVQFRQLLLESCVLPLLSGLLSLSSLIDLERKQVLYRSVLMLLSAIASVPLLAPTLLVDASPGQPPIVTGSKRPTEGADAVTLSPQSVFAVCQNLHQKCSLYRRVEGVDNEKNKDKAMLGQVLDAGRRVLNQLWGGAENPVESVPPTSPVAATGKTASMDGMDCDFMGVLWHVLHSHVLPRVGELLPGDGKGAADFAKAATSVTSALASSASGDALYIETMRPLQFGELPDGVTFSNFHYSLAGAGGAAAAEKSSIRSRNKRIAQEVVGFSGGDAGGSNLPLSASSSIWVRCSGERMDHLQAMISGPEGTPYSNGLFLFDIAYPSSYPSTPPLVNLQTTGKRTVRFNPNLYNCGKVCLSLLGTWRGGGEASGEGWNGAHSTLLQVLVSIQSLILVDDPYFNEPGYENTMGTESGTVSSMAYNVEVMANCVAWAMVDQLQNPPNGFAEIVQAHFTLKKDEIRKQLQTWRQRIDALHRKLHPKPAGDTNDAPAAGFTVPTSTAQGSASGTGTGTATAAPAAPLPKLVYAQFGNRRPAAELFESNAARLLALLDKL